MTDIPSQVRSPSYLALVLYSGLVVGMVVGATKLQGLPTLHRPAEKAWGQESFWFVCTLLALAWGLLQLGTGLLADKFGAGRVVASGSALYAIGLVLEMGAESTPALSIGAGFIVGAGLIVTAFAMVYGGLSRFITGDRRGAG